MPTDTSTVTAKDDRSLSHLRVMAAAGSGKTFQLTNRFLRLLFLGASTRTILASTFTKLAAGEIRQRVVKRLLDAAESDDAARTLGRDIGVDDLTVDRARDVLAALTRELQQLQVRTIDAFFATIVRAFALELGLPRDINMLDEAAIEAIHQETVERILDQRDPGDTVELLRRLSQGKMEASVAALILREVQGLSALYHEARDGAMQFVEPYGAPLDPESIAIALTRLAELELTGKQLPKFKKTVLDQATAGAWQSFVSETGIQNIINGKMKFGSSKLPDELVDALEPLIEHAIAVVVERYRQRAAAMEELIRAWDANLAELKRERGGITFDDLTRSLTNAGAIEVLDDIYYRIDAHLHHVLLDEFQDTSLGQWKVLFPIVDETVSYAPPQRTFYCVGDVKQSIYGWRQASPWILSELPEILSHGADESRIDDMPMSKSWRSAPDIMDFTNLIFEDLPRNEALTDLTSVAERWMKGFREHETAHTTMAGHVNVQFADNDPDEPLKATEATLDHAVTLVKRLHTQSPNATIAVLVRKNATVSELVYRLRSEGVPASSDGGGALTDSAPVSIILDALRLADHAADTESCFNVATSPLGEELGLSDQSWQKHRSLERARAAQRIRRRIAEDGYGTTLGRWAKLLAPDSTGEEHIRLLRLLSLADEFDGRMNTRTDEFVRFVQHKKVPQRTFAPVRVMSVHQSKGLEFDIVVLPELTWPLPGHASKRKIYFERDEATQEITRLAPDLKAELRPLIEGLEQVHNATVEAATMDGLSVLYVAVTRAIRGLYVILPPPATNKNGTRKRTGYPSDSPGWLMECAVLGGDVDEVVPGQTIYTTGDESAMFDAIRAEHGDRHSADVDESCPEDHLDLSGLASDSIARARAASDHASDEIARRSEVLALPNRDALDRGTAIHALFEDITWIDLDELAPFDANLAAERLRVLLPTRDAAWRQERCEEFLQMIAQPEIAACLAPPADPDSVDVRCEFPFARQTSSGLQRGFIDRLHLHLDESGAVVGATVLDFKTDELRPDQDPLTEATEHYGSQLAEYAAVVGAMFGLDEASIGRVILYVTEGVVVTLANTP